MSRQWVQKDPRNRIARLIRTGFLFELILALLQTGLASSLLAMAISLVPQAFVVAPGVGDSNTGSLPDTALYKERLFAGYPELKKICTCESGLEQYAKGSTTTVLRGRENPKDAGICQINEFYHKEKAVALGYDIHTTSGNVGYAKYLYDTQGDKPWVWSQACWDKPLKTAEVTKKTKDI